MNLKENNKIGKLVKLYFMKGETIIQKGMIGEIITVDSLGTIHVKWENGRLLGLIPEKDEYKILSDKDIRKIKIEKLKKLGLKK